MVKLAEHLLLTLFTRKVWRWDFYWAQSNFKVNPNFGHLWRLNNTSSNDYWNFCADSALMFSMFHLWNFYLVSYIIWGWNKSLPGLLFFHEDGEWTMNKWSMPFGGFKSSKRNKVGFRDNQFVLKFKTQHWQRKKQNLTCDLHILLFKSSNLVQVCQK